jgi:trehalose/maltose hydrolase-like predicted phosphorylase
MMTVANAAQLEIQGKVFSWTSMDEGCECHEKNFQQEGNWGLKALLLSISVGTTSRVL